jgi:hypothetical protein
MKIEVFTSKGKELVAAIDKEIANKAIVTWRIIKSTKEVLYYTHTPDQWDNKAIIGRDVKTDRVEFLVTGWDKALPSENTKGYYAGRFAEILMVHMRDYFSKLEITK